VPCKNELSLIVNILHVKTAEVGNVNRLRSGNSDCVHGRLFVSFLAVTLRSLIESKLRAADLMKNHSVPEALNLLGKIKRITFPDGRTYQLEIPKKTRIFAEAIGLPLL